MNQVQIAIIIVVAIIVLGIIVYYIYQENKFKKLIASNFNQLSTDALTNETDLIFENQAVQRSAFATSNRDVVHEQIGHEQIVQKAIPLEQTEIDFIKFDESTVAQGTIKDREQAQDKRQYSTVSELDHIIEVTFPKLVKIKALPEITPYTTKPAKFLIKNKDGEWIEFVRGQKYSALGLQLVVSLVDTDGVISLLQLNNLYNEF